MNFFRSRLFILISAVVIFLLVGSGIFFATAPKTPDLVAEKVITKESFEKATFLNKLGFGPTSPLSSTKLLDENLFLYSTKDGLNLNKNPISNSQMLQDKVIYSTLKVGNNYILNFGQASYWLKNQQLEKIDKAISITNTAIQIDGKIQNSFIYLVKKDTELVVATSTFESFLDNAQILGKLPITNYGFAELINTQGTVYLFLYKDETKTGNVQIMALPTAQNPQLTLHYVIKNVLDLKIDKEIIYYKTVLSTPTDLTIYDFKSVDLKNKIEISLNSDLVYPMGQENILGSFSPNRCTSNKQILYCIVKKAKISQDSFASPDVVIEYNFANKNVRPLYNTFSYSASEIFSQNAKIYLISQQEKQIYEIK
jgi:virulence-associated protein VapD